jgi:hypothetical protein
MLLLNYAPLLILPAKSMWKMPMQQSVEPKS